MSNMHARRYIHELYLGGGDGLGLLKSRLGDDPAPRALELCGGRGDFALNVIKRGIADAVTLVDLSPTAIDIARKKAADAGIETLTTHVADCNEIDIDERWPLVLFSHSLHHIENLEHVISEVRDALAPGGVLYVNDYIGPSRMQWTDEQLDIMNRLLTTIPESLLIRIDKGGDGPGTPKTEIRRVPVEAYLRDDPSEAARSAEIPRLIMDAFPNAEFFPLGGTITYELFRGIAHNFVEDETAIGIMKSIITLEHSLIQRGMPSDFGLFICRK